MMVMVMNRDGLHEQNCTQEEQDEEQEEAETTAAAHTHFSCDDLMSAPFLRILSCSVPSVLCHVILLLPPLLRLVRLASSSCCSWR